MPLITEISDDVADKIVSKEAGSEQVQMPQKDESVERAVIEENDNNHNSPADKTGLLICLIDDQL